MEYEATAIVSCYNSRRFLPHKIQNLLESTLGIQIVLVDCSAGEDLKDIQHHLGNPKIKHISFKERITLWKAVNIGIKMSDAPLVIQANTDDLVSSHAYANQIQKIYEGFDISYFNYYITSGYHKTWAKAVKKAYSGYRTPENGYSLGKTLGPFPMWRKSLHAEVGYFDENFEIGGDSRFWMRLANANKRFGNINKKLGAYAQRRGEGDMNLEVRQDMIAKDRAYYKKLKKNT